MQRDASIEWVTAVNARGEKWSHPTTLHHISNFWMRDSPIRPLTLQIAIRLASFDRFGLWQ